MSLTLLRPVPRDPSRLATQQRPWRRSALYGRQVILGATFTDLAGWQVADAFRGRDEEVAAARAGVGLVDLSPHGKLRLIGRDLATRLTAPSSGWDLPPPGQLRQVSPSDGWLDASWLLGLLADEYLLLTEPDAVATTAARLIDALGTEANCAHVSDLTSSLVMIGLVGPHSREVLRQVTSLDVRPWRFPDRSCRQGSLAQVPGIVVRSDRGDLPAFRLLTTRAYGAYLWDALVERGHGLDMTPLGRQAWLALD